MLDILRSDRGERVPAQARLVDRKQSFFVALAIKQPRNVVVEVARPRHHQVLRREHVEERVVVGHVVAHRRRTRVGARRQHRRHVAHKAVDAVGRQKRQHVVGGAILVKAVERQCVARVLDVGQREHAQLGPQTAGATRRRSRLAWRWLLLFVVINVRQSNNI